MNNVSKLTAEQIKQDVDNAVVDYIESRKTFNDLIRLTCRYNNPEMFTFFDNSGYGEITNLLHKIGGDLFDDKEVPKKILKALQDYYWKIDRFPDLTKLTAEEIKQAVDAAVIDYIEGRDTIDDLARRIFPYDDNEAFFILDKSPYSELISHLDMVGYEPYSEDGNLQSLHNTLQAYYDRLKVKSNN